MIRRASRFNQKNFALALAGITLAAIFSFFIYQLKFLRPPRFEITQPAKDLIQAENFTDAGGRADPDADLTLNGRPLYSGGAGEFVERVHLVKGVNKLEFEARNRYGKAVKITRYIVVR